MYYELQWFESAFEERPDATVVSDSRASLTASELQHRGRRVAAFIASTGARYVGLEIEPGCDWLTALRGVWLAGAVAVPIDPAAGVEVRERLVARCDLVLSEVSELHEFGEVQPNGVLDPMSPAVVLLTSGTSSAPTEVMLSHGNLVAQAIASRSALDGTRSDRWLSTLPVNHTGGLTVPARTSVWGAEAIVLPGFDVRAACELLMDPAEAITLVSLVPTMLLRLLDHGLANPPTLRRAVVSGAPFGPALRERALECGIPVVESWGMTETTGMAAIERNPRAGGAGRPLDGVHIELSADGIIRVGGGTVAPGVMVGGMFDTGDLGEFRDGNLHVLGRSGSLIISGGHNVSPERVESVVDAHPLVSQSLVYGVPDETWGELVCADVMFSGEASDEDLLAFCRDRLSAWETPRVIRRVDSIPLTKTGKPVRSAGRRQ